jgi:hypothetical protein
MIKVLPAPSFMNQRSYKLSMVKIQQVVVSPSVTTAAARAAAQRSSKSTAPRIVSYSSFVFFFLNP